MSNALKVAIVGLELCASVLMLKVMTGFWIFFCSFHIRCVGCGQNHDVLIQAISANFNLCVGFDCHLGTMEAEHQQQNNRQEGRPSQKLQHVCTLSTKKKVVEWRIEDATLNTERRLMSRTIQAFLEYFQGNAKANHINVSRWWANQENLLNLETMQILLRCM